MPDASTSQYPESAGKIRSLINEMLERRPPIDDRERTSVDRFSADLDRLAEPCSETADITHVTASVFVVSNRGVVLHRHKRLGIWIQPGGHIDPGETSGEAALRECLEETGLRAEHFSGEPMLVHIDAHDAPRGHFHLDLRFLLAGDPLDPAPPDGESPDVCWVPFERAAETCHGDLVGAMRALTQFTLRPGAPGDSGPVAEVYLRSFRHAYRDTDVRLAHDDTDVRRWVRDDLLPAESVTVAVVCGIVVGFVATRPGWLSHLYVDPGWIGHGVGAALFDHAVAQQPNGLRLWTFQANQHARAFYAARGLLEVARTDGDNDEHQPDVCLEWTPSPSSGSKP